MIHVYTSSSEKTAASIESMLKSVDIKPHFYKIHDVNREPVEIGNNLCHVAFGKKAIKIVKDQLIEEGIIGKDVYVGRPMIDEKSGWFFYGIHLDVPEIMASDENKYYVYEILQDLAKNYFHFNPINDDINFGTAPIGRIAVASNDGQGDLDLQQSAISEAEVAIATTEYGIEATGKIDTLDLIAKVVEKVDFSDVGLGKSLAKFPKIQLITNNGYTLNVLPNIRSDETADDKEINISYKDLLSLLKVVVLTGSRSIEFFRG